MMQFANPTKRLQLSPGIWKKQQRWRLGWCCAALLLAGPGCDFKTETPRVGPKLAEVRGIVTLNGKPLSRAHVSFDSYEWGPPAFAITDSEGKYEIHYAGNRQGAPVGGHTIRITRQFNPATETPPKELPAKYNSKTELKVRVEPETNVVNFDLKE